MTPNSGAAGARGAAATKPNSARLRAGPSAARGMGAAAIAALLTACAGPLDAPRTDRFRAPHAEPAANSDAPPARPADRFGARDQAPPTLGPESGLEDYLRYAALNNAGLEAAWHAYRAALEVAPQAGSLPDPQLSYSHFIRQMDMRAEIGVSQMFPGPGKRRLRREGASHRAKAALEQFEDARLALFQRVAESYAELYYLGRSIDAAGQSLRLLERVEGTVRARLRVAAAEHADLVRVQIQLSRAEDRLAELEQLRPALTARMNAALNRNPAAPVPLPDSLPELPDDDDGTDLAAALAEQNPELAAMARRVDAAATAHQLARRETTPDLELGLTYGFAAEQGMDDPIMAMVSISLPIYRGRIQAARREALAQRLSLAWEREQRKNDLLSEMHEALFALRDARRRGTLYEQTLIPQGDKAFEAVLGAYRTGEATLLEVIQSQDALIEFALAAERARADAMIARARLERLIGGRTDRTDPGGTGDPATERAAGPRHRQGDTR